jgi:hypothetical protein
MIDFFILYEVPTRELESILILGNELKCRGYSVEYASFYDVDKSNYLKNHKRLKKYYNNVRVLIVPSFYHDREMLDFFYYPFGRVEKIVNLRWEQYYISEIMENPREHAFLYPNEKGKNAFQVCWGPVSHQNLLDFGIAEDRLLDTGPMHMDILRDEFHDYFLSRDELLNKYNLNTKQQTILFISSFTNATDKSSTFKYYEKFFSGKYIVDYNRIELEQASYAAALKWFDDFMTIHQDVNFVYRPHPSEFLTGELKKLEEKYPNFVVISEESVKQWILASETIVTWMSTSIIEAYFAHKPCFIIRPVLFPLEKDMCIYKGATFISDEAEFLNITNTICENSLSEKYIHQCYDVQRDIPSYIRLCDELERILLMPELFPWDNKQLWLFDRSRTLLALKNYGRLLISKAKKVIVQTMFLLQKVFKISFGKRINERLSVSKNNSQKYKYSIGFAKKDDALGSIVRKQNEQIKANKDESEADS